MFDIKGLSKEQKEALLNELIKDIQKDNSSNRFEEKGVNNFICPHCKSDKIQKNGKANNQQRFACKNCRKTYTIQTRTLFHSTKKDLSLWYKYIELMFAGKSLRDISEIMNINLKTSFYWRHKILNALSGLKEDKLKGIVEVDETFFRYSEKGNKNLNRKPRKRGEKAIKRGLSKEQVCVVCAIDRSKTSFNKSVGFGRVQPTLFYFNN